MIIPPPDKVFSLVRDDFRKPGGNVSGKKQNAPAHAIHRVASIIFNRNLKSSYMKKLLLCLVFMAISFYGSTQGSIAELQKKFRYHVLFPSALELNLTLNSLSTLLATTKPESGFRNGFCQPSFSPAGKHRGLLSPSENILDITNQTFGYY
ncbi:MAG TPA: hypothetical protein DCM62_06235 [Bacteroidales bacterium]|nr:hypothetical protein [Bacteroidales bacterium]